MKANNTKWVIKAYTGLTGWKELKTFSNPGEADAWLMGYVKENGYSIEDFKIVRR